MAETKQAIDIISDQHNHEELAPPRMSRLQKLLTLTKFMLPLIFTQMVPDLGDQVLNRALVSVANAEMILLLASFGLGLYLVRIVTAPMFECKHISIVLVRSIADYKKMLLLVILMSTTMSAIVLAVSFTHAGVWLIRDLHRQSEEVTELSLQIARALVPLPILEAIANFHEGALIKRKLTMYTGCAKIVDFILQVLFVVILLFTPTRDEPILIPIAALYAGVIGRAILDVGFWYVLVRRKLPASLPGEKATGLLKGFVFYLPLGLVKFVQDIYRPMINLFVSRQLAATSVEKATTALAVLTAVYPVRFLHSWLDCLRMVIPTFHKSSHTHEKFRMKFLVSYGVSCTLFGFAFCAIMLTVREPARFMMKTIVGLEDELVTLTMTPLKILSGLSLFSGLRAVCAGYLIDRKKTIYLTPSALIRFGLGIAFLVSLPHLGLTGAELGATVLVLGFADETICVAIGILVMKFVIPRMNACIRRLKQKENQEVYNVAELSSLTEKASEHESGEPGTPMTPNKD